MNPADVKPGGPKFYSNSFIFFIYYTKAILAANVFFRGWVGQSGIPPLTQEFEEK